MRKPRPDERADDRSGSETAFQRVLNDSSLYAMAVLDNYNREYMGHVFIEFESEGRAELGFYLIKPTGDKFSPVKR